MEFTDRAALLYMQEGMAFTLLQEMGLENRPVSRQEILGNPFLMKLMRIQAQKELDKQGAEFLQDLDGTRVGTVLDIGCGLGLCSLALYQVLNPKPTLFLVDGGRALDGDEATYMNSFKNDGTDLVSDLRVTMDLLLRNGVPQEKMNYLGPVADNVRLLRPGSIDLVFSNVSWFYHYPPEIYWDAVREAMHSDSVMRVDIQMDYLSPHPEYVDFLNAKFREVQELRTIGGGRTLTVLARGPR